MNATINVIDTVKKPGYAQWIEGFVRNVMIQADKEEELYAEEVEITEVVNKTIRLEADCGEFKICITNITPVERDENGLVCGEEVEYFLYERDGAIDYTFPIDPIVSGKQIIKWSNDAAVIHEEVEEFIKNGYGLENMERTMKEGYVTLLMYDFMDTGWYIAVPTAPLTQAELDRILWYLLSGIRSEQCTDPKLVDILNQVSASCVNYVTELCIDSRGFYHEYTMRTLKEATMFGYCDISCSAQLAKCLDTLYKKHKKGDEAALAEMQEKLHDFIEMTKPYETFVE